MSTWFRGNLAYLSNFFPCSVTVSIEGKEYTFKDSEAAFQAFKCPERAQEFTYRTKGNAKKHGKEVPLRPDWEQIKDDVMYNCVKAKFTQNPYLMERLLQSPDILVENNTWGDTYWGAVNGRGKNMLGLILMQIREEERIRRSKMVESN